MANIPKDEIDKIISTLDSMVQDTSIPRNVRNRLQEAKEKLNTPDDLDVALSTAVYSLDDVSNDINLPMHARTMIWSLLSELEALKNK